MHPKPLLPQLTSISGHTTTASTASPPPSLPPPPTPPSPRHHHHQVTPLAWANEAGLEMGGSAVLGINAIPMFPTDPLLSTAEGIVVGAVDFAAVNWQRKYHSIWGEFRLRVCACVGASEPHVRVLCTG